MIGPRVEVLSRTSDALAGEAESSQKLAAQARAIFPNEPVGILGRAAITDPARSGGDTKLRLQGAAMALRDIESSGRVLDRPGP